MPSRNYRDLIVWQKAMDLVVEIYRLTKALPKEEIYGLTQQMRRAAVSIPSNIAEGQGRGSGQEMIRYLRIAYGSLRELETQSEITERLRYSNEEDVSAVMSLMSEVGRLFNGLIRSKE
jgi:four helix bundle protein